MEMFLPVDLRRFLSGCGAVAVLVLMTQGCGSKSGETQATGQTLGAKGAGEAPHDPNAPDADLRKGFSQKNFDINKVPPEQRERVRAIMQQNASSGASAPGAAQK